MLIAVQVFHRWCAHYGVYCWIQALFGLVRLGVMLVEALPMDGVDLGLEALKFVFVESVVSLELLSVVVVVFVIVYDLG